MKTLSATSPDVSGKGAAEIAKDLQAAKSRSTDAERKYDVYATPFVLSILRAINKDEACVVITKPKHQNSSILTLTLSLGLVSYPPASGKPYTRTIGQQGSQPCVDPRILTCSI
jgi:hypothetical protein